MSVKSACLFLQSIFYGITGHKASGKLCFTLIRMEEANNVLIVLPQCSHSADRLKWSQKTSRVHLPPLRTAELHFFFFKLIHLL